MIPVLQYSHRSHSSISLAHPRDCSAHVSKGGQRPIEPAKAVLQKASLNPTSGLLLNPSQPVKPPTGAPRRQLRSKAFSSVDSEVAFRERDRAARSAESLLSPPRLRIAVDVDEVLGRFVFTLNQFLEERHGMKYKEEDYWVYEYAKIWQCSQEQSNHIVHEFFKSRHFSDGIPVIPGAFDALTRLGAAADLVVVTSRQHIIQDITLEWIDRHYAGLFQEVYFGNHFALEGVSKKKSEICGSIGAGVLIDDNPGYALDCAQAGINVLLYDWHDAYPWSKLPAGKHHPLITIVRDWNEVEQAIEMLAPKLANVDQLG